MRAAREKAAERQTGNRQSPETCAVRIPPESPPVDRQSPLLSDRSGSSCHQDAETQSRTLRPRRRVFGASRATRESSRDPACQSPLQDRCAGTSPHALAVPRWGPAGVLEAPLVCACGTGVLCGGASDQTGTPTARASSRSISAMESMGPPFVGATLAAPPHHPQRILRRCRRPRPPSPSPAAGPSIIELGALLRRTAGLHIRRSRLRIVIGLH